MHVYRVGAESGGPFISAHHESKIGYVFDCSLQTVRDCCSALSTRYVPSIASVMVSSRFRLGSVHSCFILHVSNAGWHLTWTWQSITFASARNPPSNRIFLVWFVWFCGVLYPSNDVWPTRTHTRTHTPTLTWIISHRYSCAICSEQRSRTRISIDVTSV